MRIKNSISSLFLKLKTYELEKKKIDLPEILSTAKWKESTFLTYWKKGQLAFFLSAQNDSGPFDVSNTTNINEVEFAKKLSQSKHIQELGHNCTSKLAKSLLKRSKENMILALEIYNRPSLENRIDCFALCFCTAWEQILKAKIIESHGEEEIYDKKARVKYGKTISLRQCLKVVFKEPDSVKDNIEKIVDYRDYAAHLLMPETQGLLSRLFQSGVINYSMFFEAFSELPFLNPSQSGLLTITGNISNVNLMQLNQTYGNSIGNDVLNLVNELEQEIENKNDSSFAIPLPIKLVYAKDDEHGNPVVLSYVEEGIAGLKKAIVIEKPIDREITHPYKESDVVSNVNRIISSQTCSSSLSTYFVAQDKYGKYIFTSHDFRLITRKMKWKNSNNEWHYENKDPQYHRYSEKVISDICKMITKNEINLSSLRLRSNNA
ncbi:DUF3644 domain-containing protein [Aeromonas jandaei]|nr:DUF3644 domain-containing protein [Aeromonas jandaei]